MPAPVPVVAQAVHDLGSAPWFGGAVMGVAGVDESGSGLDPRDRPEPGGQRGLGALRPGPGATGYAASCGSRTGAPAEEAHATGPPVETKDATIPTAATPKESSRGSAAGG